MKRVPYFWWDFEWNLDRLVAIIVESDDSKYPICARFPFQENKPDDAADGSMRAIELASLAIRDFERGNVNYRKVARGLCREFTTRIVI